MGAKKKARKAAKATARLVEQLVLNKRTELVGKGWSAAEIAKQLASPGEIAAMEAEAANLRTIAAQVRKGSTPQAIYARAKVAEYALANSISTPFGLVAKGDAGHVSAVDRMIKMQAAQDGVAKALQARDAARSEEAIAAAEARILTARSAVEKLQSANKVEAGLDRLAKLQGGEPRFLVDKEHVRQHVTPNPFNVESERLMRGPLAPPLRFGEK